MDCRDWESASLRLDAIRDWKDITRLLRTLTPHPHSEGGGMSLDEYHARQRANAVENEHRERMAKVDTAARSIGSIPDLLRRIEALERRVQVLEVASTPKEERES